MTKRVIVVPRHKAAEVRARFEAEHRAANNGLPMPPPLKIMHEGRGQVGESYDHAEVYWLGPIAWRLYLLRRWIGRRIMGSAEPGDV